MLSRYQSALNTGIAIVILTLLVVGIMAAATQCGVGVWP